MSTITWPSNIKVGAVDYSIEFDVQMSVMRNGRITTFVLPGARWVASVKFEDDLEQRNRPALEALIVSLEGGGNRLAMPHWGRVRPNGTLTGSPTVASTAAAGAKSIALQNCNGTLKAGDIIGIPGQLVMVIADATPVANAMTVQVRPSLRAQQGSGTAITWNKPTTLWVPRSSVAGPFPYVNRRFRPGFTVDFVEAPL